MDLAVPTDRLHFRSLFQSVLSFSEPEAVKDIYATKKHYMKVANDISL